MPSPALAPPSRGLLPLFAKPKLVLPAAKAIVRRNAEAQARARAQPVALAKSMRLDEALSAGFVRLLNAGHVQDADSGGGTGERYDPKPGDFAVGVVVSGTEARLDVAVGADRLATLLAKELLPLDRSGADPAEQAAPPRPGSVGVVAGPSVGEDEARKQKRGSRALVAPGTVVFAEVLGRTLSGRPLLSARRLFRRLAWHRARQIKQLDEPIEVKIYEWNTGGLLTKIEGLRAFLPKFELMDRISTFAELKAKVGCSIRVCIIRLDEETNDVIISEKKAWEMTFLKEGTLLKGTVRKIFSYGAQVRIAGTNRSGLLHVSKISRGQVLSVSDILNTDDEVKVLVIKSNVPDKIALSIADLESVPGLFLSDKAVRTELHFSLAVYCLSSLTHFASSMYHFLVVCRRLMHKVFSEAEEMAQIYREQLPVISQNTSSEDHLPGETIPFDDEATLYANWKWFKFLRQSKPGDNSDGT